MQPARARTLTIGAEFGDQEMAIEDEFQEHPATHLFSDKFYSLSLILYIL